MLLVRKTFLFKFPDKVSAPNVYKSTFRERNRLATTTQNTEADSQNLDLSENCSNIDGVTVSVSSEVAKLTNFVNEDCNSVTIRGAMKVRPIEHTSDTSNVTDIASYFSRPKVIGNYTYNHTVRTIIVANTITNDFIRNTVTNFARVGGAYGYRATVCFRIQAISNPFQAGRLRMVFQPFALTSLHHSRAASLTGCSQLPGVELDLAESTAAEMKIPFIHPNNFFCVQNLTSIEELGTLSVIAYTPLAVAAGTVAPKFTMWMWLEDFELIGAAPTLYTAQAGKFTKNASSKEADAVPGSVSNVLAAGANLATWLGKKIPLISGYAGPASWVLREAGNIAASYGWAKPVTVLVPAKMLDTNNVYQANCDAPDVAFNMGTTTDNAIVPYSGFAGTDVDEMSIAFLTSIYAAIASPTLSTLNPPKTVVYACSLCPSSMYYNGTSLNRQSSTKPKGVSFWPSPLYALSNVFEKWTGGFRFRIKISKTKFHTGRLLLGFTPYFPGDGGPIYAPGNLDDMQFKSVIWDLREGNVMEFDCPFVSPLPYLNGAESYGTFFISVLDQLSGPDTVSTVLPFIVEVCGVEGFEFAVPIAPIDVHAPQGTLYSAQGGEFKPFDATTVDSAQICIGEKLNSIKQLLSRACPFALLRGSTTTMNVTSVTGFPTFMPNNTAPTSLANIEACYLSYFQQAYVLSRGGFVLDVVPHVSGLFLTAYPTKVGLDANAICTEGRTALHVKAPYFCKRSKNITTSNYSNPNNGLTITCRGGSSTIDSSIVYRRAAEDFQLGYFIGFPPLTPKFTPETQLTTGIRSVLQLA